MIPSHANYHMATHDNEYVDWEELDIAGATTIDYEGVDNKYQDGLLRCEGCNDYFWKFKEDLCIKCRK